MQYCPHCLAPNVSGKTCPKCGKDVTQPNPESRCLPVGTLLTSHNGARTYWIGAAREIDCICVSYAAMEIASQQRVLIKEYIPSWFAVHAKDNLVWASKPRFQDYQKGLANFLEEGRQLLPQKDLPSLVHVLDCFRANATGYLVMESLDGVSLHDRIAKYGPVPMPILLQMLLPLFRDLSQLHHRGILHLGIRPEKLMLLPGSRIKLLDFEDSRILPYDLFASEPVWYPFMPLEHFQKKPYGPYSDVYSLAAVLYYCITGKFPPEAVRRLLGEPLQPPTALASGITEEQETALLWALSVQPNARPQTIDAFHNALYLGIFDPNQSPPPLP